MVEALWPGGARNRVYNARSAQRFPESPCSYTAQWPSAEMYRGCIDRVLTRAAYRMAQLTAHRRGHADEEESPVNRHLDAHQLLARQHRAWYLRSTEWLDGDAWRSIEWSRRSWSELWLYRFQAVVSSASPVALSI